MVNYGVPRTATIGTQTTWATPSAAIVGFSPATFNLLWVFGDQLSVIGSANGANTAWTTATDFLVLSLGDYAWSLRTVHKATNVETPIDAGGIFLETPEYTVLRQQVAEIDKAILTIVKGGGNQTISIKGRSTTKYGLSDLRALRTQVARQLEVMRSGGRFGQVLVRF